MVLEQQMAKKHFLGIISTGNLQNDCLDQKVLEVWPPQNEVSKAKQGFWVSKKFFGPPKIKKIDFLKKH